MTAGPDQVGSDPPRLGALLVLLHNADGRLGSLAVTYRVWSQRPAEHEETVRIWLAGERIRVEHHGGERDGYYAVMDGPLWWMWDERMGGRSNEADPSVGGGFGNELQIMRNPVPLLSSLRFESTGRSHVAGRPTITAIGTPRPHDPGGLPPAGLHELGAGAERYELEVDEQRGVLLAATAVRDGQPFHRITTLEVQFDEPIADETFRFQPPAGEAIQPLRDEHRVQNVTLTEAQRETPFTVLMPDTVPATWQVRCRLIRASQRPPSPVQIGLIYTSVDGHESVSLTQAAVGPSNPYGPLGWGENWESVTRDGVSMMTRPARWGQAQVELEREGTFVHLMSDNLTRDQLLTIAAGLRPAPSTSSI